ncbi:MAG TPA: hypothetical protein VF175_11110 [Lacipirellula sp.]
MNARKRSLFGIGALALAALIVQPLFAAEIQSTQKEFVLEKEPKKSKGVIKVRKEAKNGEEVVVIGRIGGRTNPWVKGAAAFTIVDESVKSCDQIPGDTCPTPWDYCCEAGLPQKTVFVSFVDEAGKIVKKDARKLLKVRELRTVVIKGKVKRDKSDNVSIQATSLYVRPDTRAAQ